MSSKKNDKKTRKSILKNKVIIFLAVFFVLVVSIITAFTIYVNDYYHADLDAITTFSSSSDITKEVLDDNKIVYSTTNATTGLIFYPGGKVEALSYEPLMKALASKGILCVLIEMPFNLAVFNINAADRIQEKYPDIDSWYIGGHSLGGAMASSYISNNKDKFAGLILLGAYSTSDISNTSLKVISIYGSNDNILNKNKYEENKKNLPTDFIEIIIEGGCHSYFGMYGKQSGDGIATLSNEEQINKTTEIISNYIS